LNAEPEPFSARLDLLEAVVRRHTDLRPSFGIVLGSGLGGLASELDVRADIPFVELPGWPAPTAPGHAGRLLLGTLRGLPVACMQGRLHLYEGHSARLVVEPALLLGRLGAPVLLLTNASGGVDQGFGPGTLMLIRDHLNLTGHHPLVGPAELALGPRFPDMTAAWDPELCEMLLEAAESEGVALAQGVYAGLRGPSYETPAEIRMLRTLGAHAVGMSSVMEAIAAHWAGQRVCGVSLVTNAGAGLSEAPLTHEEVLEAAAEAGPRLARVIGRFVERLASVAPA
jgi:purine-nucleoside phosphorylase